MTSLIQIDLLQMTSITVVHTSISLARVFHFELSFCAANSRATSGSNSDQLLVNQCRKLLQKLLQNRFTVRQIFENLQT